MKKLFAFLTSLLYISALVSCEDSAPAPESVPVSEQEAVESVSEEPEVPEYLELSADDFAEIGVKLSQQKSEPPVKVEDIPIELAGYEEIMSPCKLPENRGEHKDSEHSGMRFSTYVLDEDNEIGGYQFDEDKFNAACDKPCRGIPGNVKLAGDTLYYTMSYDDLCLYNGGDHCFKIFAYNIRTKESEELYSYVSDDTRMSIDSISVVNGEIFLSTYTENDEGGSSEICRLRDGKIETFIDDENAAEYSLVSSAYGAYEEVSDKIMLYRYIDSVKTEGDYFTYTIEMAECDPETGKVTPVCTFASKGDFVMPVKYRGEYIHSTFDDDMLTVIEGEHFRFDTGLKKATLISATDKQIALIKNGGKAGNKVELFVFDLEKMQKYSYNLNGYASSYGVMPLGNNFMLNFQGIVQSFLLTDLGISFCVNSADTSGFMYNGFKMNKTPEGVCFLINSFDGFSMDENGEVFFSIPEKILLIHPE